MRKILLQIGVLCFILWAVVGCSAMKATYGSIVLDQAAEKNFAAFLMDPGMNYYYSGPDYYPNALIGLKKEYVLDNDLWKPIGPNPVVFGKLIRSMQDKAHDYGAVQRGFAIKDHEGKPIGVWYSIVSIKTMNVRMGEGNKVVIDTPELIIYPQDRDGKKFGPLMR